MKKPALLLFAGLLGYVVAAGAPTTGSAEPATPAARAWFSMRGKVTRVVDGDTLSVRIGRTTERVRLIGIDAPEVGGCFAANATAALRRLALNRTVRLSGDRTQTRRDVYKRLLAYVNLPSGVDAGRQLLAGGFATVYETRRPFARRPAYVAAAAAADRADAGMHTICPTVAQPPPASPLPIAPPISTTTNPPTAQPRTLTSASRRLRPTSTAARSRTAASASSTRSPAPTRTASTATATASAARARELLGSGGFRVTLWGSTRRSRSRSTSS